MSSTSSFSSYGSHVGVTCICKKPAKVETARTSKNPGRLFYGCRYRECNFFQWVDEGCGYMENCSQEMNIWIGENLRLRRQLDQLSQRIHDLEAMNVGLKVKNSMIKRQAARLRLGCICLAIWLIYVLL
ncbi:uncharacterized protein LOC131025606 [Salvia miltiorrhiza]|uniref:uncharacterized protein LOC131025606 n=1 Tax=Salvia miltiorrhiza TaxID=226208 RepID=UPI0025AD2DF8|nr:uncharacterized protein LOC131025606 [Salvia miltiorrhiza]